MNKSSACEKPRNTLSHQFENKHKHISLVFWFQGESSISLSQESLKNQIDVFDFSYTEWKQSL